MKTKSLQRYNKISEQQASVCRFLFCSECCAFIPAKGADSPSASRTGRAAARPIPPASDVFASGTETESARFFRTFAHIKKAYERHYENSVRLSGQHLPLPGRRGHPARHGRPAGVADRIEIDSAGTYGGTCRAAARHAHAAAAAQRGYELTHRARQVREEDFERFDRIIVMDDMNYETLHRLAPSRAAAQRIFRMTEFCRRHPGRSYVPDPYL